jgi:hypothetical protein
MTTQAVRLSLLSKASQLGSQGILLRAVDANNYVQFLRKGPGTSRIEGQYQQADGYRLIRVVAGVGTVIGELNITTPRELDLIAFATATGIMACYATTVGGEPGVPIFEVYDPSFATGGTLASGKAGLYSVESGLGAEVLDNFSAWAPSEPVLIASGRRLRWRHDSVQKEDTGGGELWSNVPYEGDPLYVPPATKESRLMRAIVFPTRGDLQNLADEGASDDFTAQLALTSRHLSVR